MPIDPSTITFYVLALITCAAWHAMLLYARRPPRPRFPNAPEGPRCQQCGYLIYRGESPTCPECGADLSPPKLIDISPLEPISPIPKIVAIAIALFPVSIALGYPIASQFSSAWRGEVRNTVRTPSGDVHFWGFVRGRGPTQQFSNLSVGLPGASPSAPTRYCDADFRDTSLRWKMRKTRPGVALDESGLTQALAAQGHSATDPKTLATAKQVVAELQALRENRWPAQHFRYEMTGDQFIDPDDDLGPFFWLPSWAPWCLPLWLATTALAARPTLRRHRQRTSDFRATRDALRQQFGLPTDPAQT